MEQAKILTNKLEVDVECPYCYEVNSIEIDWTSVTVIEECCSCRGEFYIVTNLKFE